MQRGYNPRVYKGISRKGKGKWDEEIIGKNTFYPLKV
jgi:hypothetical protein